MGVVNVTPDSFSDGGRFFDEAAAVAHGVKLAAEGADILDIGGESTRPGALQVDDATETSRVIPILRRLAAETSVPLSVDTMKPAVARAAVEAGASIWNDVTALGWAPESADVAAELGCTVVLMHMQGEPRTMQQNPHYDDVVGQVRDFLAERAEAAVGAGVARDRIWIDPGIGFGKNLEHNLELLRAAGAMREDLGVPFLVGPSRKRFIGTLTGADDPADRVEGTAGAVAWCAAQRVDLVRVHDVRAMRRVVQVVDAIVREGSSA